MTRLIQSNDTSFGNDYDYIKAVLKGRTVYQANVDWTHQLTVTKDQQVGVIQKTAAKNFDHGTASRLKKGKAIYCVKQRKDLLIVELNGQIIIYAAHAEG
ncbi:hypothetical protein [Bacillus sp. NMCC46]|uniref:hypothetical protein n=1 Tax=Bacillus sp. NMCC46 TaxID=2108538 RepID=UPI001CB92BEB|nr:hypothetical protein [Bacillus sp. NMCC46]